MVGMPKPSGHEPGNWKELKMATKIKVKLEADTVEEMIAALRAEADRLEAGGDPDVGTQGGDGGGPG